MTIEQLLGYSADDLEKMTDEELRNVLLPYITRCKERINLQEQKKVIKLDTEKKRKISAKQALQAEMDAFMKELG